MSDSTSLPQRSQDVVSPTLDTTAYLSHYAVTNVWTIDSTTLLPIGVTQNITLGTSAAGVL